MVFALVQDGASAGCVCFALVSATKTSTVLIQSTSASQMLGRVGVVHCLGCGGRCPARRLLRQDHGLRVPLLPNGQGKDLPSPPLVLARCAVNGRRAWRAEGQVLSVYVWVALGRAPLEEAGQEGHHIVDQRASGAVELRV